MKNLSFLLLLTAALTIVVSCEPAKQGGYDAPSKNNDGGGFKEDVVVKIDSSIEKAIQHDTTKREYHL